MTPRPDADRLSSLAPALSRVSQVSDAYVVSPALSEAPGDSKGRQRAPRSWVLAGLSM